MAAQKGRELLLKVEASPGGGTFNTVGALRSTSISINNEIVDITNKSSAGARKLLAGAGVTSLAVSGSGVFDDDANFALVEASARANTHLNYQVVIPGTSNGRTYEAAFAITTLEQAGEYNGEVNYSITLESDGTISSS